MNTFKHDLNQLNFSNYKQADVAEALKDYEALAWSNIAAIKDIPSDQRTFENAVTALSDSTEYVSMVAGLVVHMQSVLGDSWEAEDKLANEVMTRIGSEISLDKDLYQALLDVRTNELQLKANQTRLLNDYIEGYELSGVGLPDSDKLELKKINTEISNLQIEFANNNTKAEAAAGILVPKSESLEGLSTHTIEEAAEHAKADTDNYWLEYSAPLAVEVLSNLANKKIRDQYAVMNSTMADDSNADLARRMLQLRNKQSDMLGFDTYSDMVLKTRMAKDGATALGFITDIRDKYIDKAIQERKEVTEFAKAYEGDQDLDVKPYEYISGLNAYYATKLMQKQFSISDEDTKPYFELSNVLSGMFETLGIIYGVTFKKVHSPNVWHQDAESYQIFDQNDNHIATVFCDWLTRKGKRAGAWMDQAYQADRDNGKLDEPHLGYVVANLTRPKGDTPSLLTIREVETIWHEFGHFMHFAFTSTELPEQSMMSCKWDFIEAPSQIMENFVWEPEVLSKIGKHYQTGEVISEEMVANLLDSRRFRVGSKSLRQLMFSEVDLRLHQLPEIADDFNVVEFNNTIYFSEMRLDKKPTGNGILSMLHIFAGGYDSAYYSYMWAEVIEADLYSRFKKEGPLNPETGAAYRDLVLARGDEVDPDVLVRDFLGRDFSQMSKLERDGIA